MENGKYLKKGHFRWSRTSKYWKVSRLVPTMVALLQCYEASFASEIRTKEYGYKCMNYGVMRSHQSSFYGCAFAKISMKKTKGNPRDLPVRLRLDIG